MHFNLNSFIKISSRLLKILEDDDIPNDLDATVERGSFTPETQTHQSNNSDSVELRDVTLTEKYWASSIPKQLFDLIRALHNDGIYLMTKECVLHSTLEYSCADYVLQKRGNSRGSCGSRLVWGSYSGTSYVQSCLPCLLLSSSKWQYVRNQNDPIILVWATLIM